MDIHIPKYLEPRIADLAQKRECTAVDILDSILMVLEYNPELIWRESDRVVTENVSPTCIRMEDRIVEFVTLLGCHESLTAENLVRLTGWSHAAVWNTGTATIQRNLVVKEGGTRGSKQVAVYRLAASPDPISRPS